jgi:hypothetical protein
VSFDDGEGWQPLQLNLPVTPVHDIVSEKADLVIATHGRGFFVLDGIALIRQLERDAVNSATYLFEPATAIRSVSRGVTIDYALGDVPPNVTLDILDGEGRLVRSFSSSAPARAESGDDEDAGPAPETRIPAQPGVNRFIWDMRASPSHDFPGLIMYQASTRGPIVPPGRYQARLTAGSTVLVRPFTVAKDPRLTAVSDADLQEQYRLARDIQEKFSVTNDTVTRIRQIKSDIGERSQKVTDREIRALADRVVSSLTEVEGRLYQYRNRATKDPLNFPPQLNNKLGSLLQIVDAGDSRPTDSAYVVFNELSSALDRQLAALDTLVRGDVARLNGYLDGRK